MDNPTVAVGDNGISSGSKPAASHEPKTAAMLTGLSFAAGSLGASAFLLLIFGELLPVVEAILQSPFKALFVLGVLSLVFAQVSVSSFLSRNGLLRACGADKLEGVAKFSDFVLAVLAIASISTVRNYVGHSIIALAYILVTVGMDLWVRTYARRKYREHYAQKSRHSRTQLCEKICDQMLKRLDGSSFIIVSLLLVFAYLISIFYVPADEFALVASAITERPKEFEEVVLASLVGLERGLHAAPSLFLSGAIGFHFLMTTWLIVCFMDDWNKDFKKLRSARNTGRRHGTVADADVEDASMAESRSSDPIEDALESQKGVDLDG